MAPADRIVAAIAGDQAQREAAYEQLAALARGDNDDVAATIASATLRISGALDDEARLAEVFGQFGAVLAATRREGEGAGSWVLLTFGEAEEAQSAMAGAAESLGVSGLEVRALDTQEGMSEAMRQHRARVSVSVAVAIVGPLVETVFAADVSVVSAQEYQRACAVLLELSMLSPLELCAEFYRNKRYAIAWTTPGNAYDRVFKKDPAELDRSDAMTVACDSVLSGTRNFATCFDDVCEAAGMGPLEFFEAFMPHCKLMPGNSSDEILIRLGKLSLEIARDPQGVSELLVAGMWQSITWMSAGRVAVVMPLIEAGVIDVAVASLQRHSPTEWVTHKTPIGIQACGIFTFAWSLSTLELPMNKTKLLLEKGLIDACISALKVRVPLRSPFEHLEPKSHLICGDRACRRSSSRARAKLETPASVASGALCPFSASWTSPRQRRCQ